MASWPGLPGKFAFDKEAVAKRLLKKRLGEIGSGQFIGPTEEKLTFDQMADDLINHYGQTIRMQKQLSIRLLVLENHSDSIRQSTLRLIGPPTYREKPTVWRRERNNQP